MRITLRGYRAPRQDTSAAKRYRAGVIKPFRDLFLVPKLYLGTHLSAKLRFPRKPQACQHRSRWLSAHQGATPPEPARMRPDPGGITACCDPAGVGGAVDDKPVVSPAGAGSTTGYGASIPPGWAALGAVMGNRAARDPSSRASLPVACGHPGHPTKWATFGPQNRRRVCDGYQKRLRPVARNRFRTKEHKTMCSNATPIGEN